MTQPTLQRGDTGDDVRHLQERLVVHLQNEGIRLSAIDGDFGPITEDSVRYFQRLRGLTEDGVVGDATWDLLEQDPAGSSSSGSSGSGSSGSGSSSGMTGTTLLQPLDLTIPWRLRMQWTETTLDNINLELSTLDLRAHPGASLEFLQPVGRLFGSGGIEVLNLEARTWPNWFLTWSVRGVVDWSNDHGLEIGADNEATIGAHLLRGVDLTATGNLNLRWRPMEGTGSVEPSGSIMLRFNILELLPR